MLGELFLHFHNILGTAVGADDFSGFTCIDLAGMVGGIGVEYYK